MLRLTLAIFLVAAAVPNLAIAGGDPPPGTNELYGFYFTSFTLTETAPGPTYYVIGDVFIQPGVTMTVEPGVTVLFSANHDTLNGGDYFNDSEILCEGDIVAVGTVVDGFSRPGHCRG